MSFSAPPPLLAKWRSASASTPLVRLVLAPVSGPNVLAAMMMACARSSGSSPSTAKSGNTDKNSGLPARTPGVQITTSTDLGVAPRLRFVFRREPGRSFRPCVSKTERSLFGSITIAGIWLALLLRRYDAATRRLARASPSDDRGVARQQVCREIDLSAVHAHTITDGNNGRGRPWLGRRGLNRFS